MKRLVLLCVVLTWVCMGRQALAGPVSTLSEDRILTFEDYNLTNNLPTPTWVHDGPLPSGSSLSSSLRALRAGTNHFHRSGWSLYSCRTGSAAGRASRQIVPPTLPTFNIATATNFAANLQNTLDAMICSPVFSNGVGTIYFESINNDAGRTTRLRVEIATNMMNDVTGWATNLLLDAETADLKYIWEPLAEITNAVSSTDDFDRYQRVLNYRGPLKLVIRRYGENGDGVYTDELGLDAAFAVVDNIRVSLPPAAVVVRKTGSPFDPGYPAVGTNVAVRCYVDNQSMLTPSDHTARTNRVCYRWRYLDQSIGAWKTNLMGYVDGTGDGQGNGERYRAELPVQSQEGDLEYYFVCDFDGYRYQSPDYTGLGYVYPVESDSSFPNYLRGGASEPDGREFHVRIRPYASAYGAVSVVSDQHAEPIEMALAGENLWQGMVSRMGLTETNLSWVFKGTGYHVPGADEFSTNVVYWSDVGSGPAGAEIPFGGVCAETNAEARMVVSPGLGGYVMLTLDTQSKDYMTRQAEYQNFNAWPAPPDKFSESSGQIAKQSFLNTFEAWPTNADTRYAEYFDLPVSLTNVYTRDPFVTARNWVAGSAAYVLDRAEADFDNKPAGWTGFRNVALRLKGGDTALGLGYVYNTVASRTDGIKEFSFKYRLGQPASNFDVTFDRTRFTTNNYLLRVTAADYGTLSPEQPSLSLVAYYKDPGNFYEYRVTQVPDSTTTDKKVAHQIYKWTDGIAVLKSTNYKTGYQLTSVAPFEMRLYTVGSVSTLIRCKYGNEDNIVTYTDTSSPILGGTCGFLSADCKAGFANAYLGATTVNAAELSTALTVKILDGGADFAAHVQNWYLPAGRFEANASVSPKGIFAVVPNQKLGVYLQTSSPGSDVEPSSPGTLSWTKYKEIIVSGFGYSDADFTLNDWRTEFVLLQVIGLTNMTADVAVDELSVKSWRGQQSGTAASDSWWATEAWVVSNSVAEGHVVQLDHSRADPDADQSIRSLLLESGMGMMEFDCRVLRAPAKLTVQYAPERDSEAWETVLSYEFSAVSAWDHKLAYLGTNAPGYFRVLNDRQGIYTNAVVEINNARVWDEPYVDQTSWRAYNLKITDTDHQRVMLDESKACFFNNSTTQDTDPIQNLNVPTLQSPVLENGLGELTFMARAYTNTQASTISVLASTNGWSAPTNLWFQIGTISNITNMFYRQYSVKPVDGRTYDSVKLVTTTAAGSARACVEEVVVSEPVFPGFDIANVKVLCKDANVYDLNKHQPTDLDEVGFEAEIVNKQLTPSNILMYVDYYVGTNVWGVGNWPQNETVTLPMYPTAPNSPIYRTSPTNDVPAQDSDRVVQYRVRATFLGGIPLVETQTTFENPSWYNPLDLNETFASRGWSPYYIVYAVPKGSVWINEVNAMEYVVSNGVQQIGFWDNPYIEIAVPAGVSLEGWKLDLVSAGGTETITLPAGSVIEEPVTNGYAFFVIAEKFPQFAPPPLPRVDYAYAGLENAIPSVYAGGIRLRRPMGMCEHAIAYDWDSSQGPGSADFNGEIWAEQNAADGYVYVGQEAYGGSLNVTNNKGEVRSDWVFPLYWTPGGPNVGQFVPLAELGASNVWITSTMSSLNGVQNGLRLQYNAFKLRVGTDTNILYEADDWYRINSVTINAVEQLPSGSELKSYPLALNSVQSNVSVAVQFALRQDVTDMGLSADMLTWILGFGDQPFVPSYYNDGRELSLTELYWLDANPTVTNRLEGGISAFTRDQATNYLVTVRMALNGTNCTYLQSEAVLKLKMTPSLTGASWWTVSQYVLMPDSFDTNHLCRILLPNPYEYLVPDWDSSSAYFYWVIEEWDPRVSPQPLVNTP